MHLPQGHTVGQAVGLPWPGGVGTTKAVGAHLDTQDLELVTFPPALFMFHYLLCRNSGLSAGQNRILSQMNIDSIIGLIITL